MFTVPTGAEACKSTASFPPWAPNHVALLHCPCAPGDAWESRRTEDRTIGEINCGLGEKSRRGHATLRGSAHCFLYQGQYVIQS